LVGKPAGKIPLGRTGLGWKDNIMLNLKEFGWESIGCTGLFQDMDNWRALTNWVKTVGFH